MGHQVISGIFAKEFVELLDKGNFFSVPKVTRATLATQAWTAVRVSRVDPDCRARERRETPDRRGGQDRPGSCTG